MILSRHPLHHCTDGKLLNCWTLYITCITSCIQVITFHCSPIQPNISLFTIFNALYSVHLIALFVVSLSNQLIRTSAWSACLRVLDKPYQEDLSESDIPCSYTCASDDDWFAACHYRRIRTAAALSSSLSCSSSDVWERARALSMSACIRSLRCSAPRRHAPGRGAFGAGFALVVNRRWCCEHMLVSVCFGKVYGFFCCCCVICVWDLLRESRMLAKAAFPAVVVEIRTFGVWRNLV